MQLLYITTSICKYHLKMSKISKRDILQECQGLFGFTFLITQFPSLITHNSSLIIHHSNFHTRLASSPNFHHSIFFTVFVGPYLSAGAVFFFFFFFQYPNSPKLYIYIKQKTKNRTEDRTSEEKKKPRIEDRTSEKKKSQKVVKICSYESLHVCLFTEMLLSYELWKLKTAKMCFQFP